MITHTVFFKLHHPVGSAAESDFLKAAMGLGKIPGVRNLACVKQVSAKNEFTYGLVMGFADDKAYHLYNVHPDHVAFVTKRWHPEVAAFMEIDYVAHSPSEPQR